MLQKHWPGVTLTEICRKTGSSMSMQSKIWNGKRYPSARLAKAMAAELGTTVDRLLYVLDLIHTERDKRLGLLPADAREPVIKSIHS